MKDRKDIKDTNEIPKIDKFDTESDSFIYIEPLLRPFSQNALIAHGSNQQDIKPPLSNREEPSGFTHRLYQIKSYLDGLTSGTDSKHDEVKIRSQDIGP